MGDVVERLKNWCTDWNGQQMVRGEPPRDGLHCDDLLDAADEIDRLRARVESLEADKTRLVEALYDAANTLGLWEPTPQPALKRASAVLSEMKRGGDER